MAWNSKYSTFGVIKIQGDKVHQYCSKDNYTIVSVGKPVTNALWAGCFLKALMDEKSESDLTKTSYLFYKEDIHKQHFYLSYIPVYEEGIN